MRATGQATEHSDRGRAGEEVAQERSAIERINSQALALSIERHHLRNGDSITNLNTLIDVLIHLRTLQRVRTRQAADLAPGQLALVFRLCAATGRMSWVLLAASSRWYASANGVARHGVCAMNWSGGWSR